MGRWKINCQQNRKPRMAGQICAQETKHCASQYNGCMCCCYLKGFTAHNSQHHLSEV